jgi:aminoglycoside phosphotransferase (APT) family kinase protein
MRSLSKAPVTSQQIHAIIRQHLGSQAIVAAFHELTEGFFNSAYQIELKDGLKCILKVAPPPEVRVLRYEKDILRAEVGSIRLVRQRTDVPAPDIYAYDTSHAILSSDFFLMQFLEGIPFHKLRGQLSPEQQAGIDRQAGHLTWQINQIEGDAFGYFAQQDRRWVSWRQAFDVMLTDVMQDGKDLDISLPLPYDDLQARITPLYPALDEVVTPRLVHWDLWDGNLFVDPQTLRITGLIDFERALWGDPLMEANFVFMPPDSEYMQGYGGGMLETQTQRKRRSLYNVYLFSIMVIECTYRKYETHDQENWARGMLAGELERIKQGES